jgi:hypothetical protein
MKRCTSNKSIKSLKNGRMKYPIRLFLATLIGAILIIPTSVVLLKRTKAKIVKLANESDTLKIENYETRP